MKIAITSSANNLAAAVDSRFGRAQMFILYDDQSQQFTVIDNKQNYNQVQGAGIQAGQTVVDSGAEALISGNVGPKAFQVLRAAGIKIYIAAEQMSVQEALDALGHNKLTEASAANVEAHW